MTLERRIAKLERGNGNDLSRFVDGLTRDQTKALIAALEQLDDAGDTGHEDAEIISPDFLSGLAAAIAEEA